MASSSDPGTLVIEPEANQPVRRFPVREGNAVAWRMWWLSLTGRRIRDVVCAQCYYPVRGSSGESCPECGACLPGCGVLDPRHSGNWLMPVWVAVLLGFTGVSLIALLASNLGVHALAQSLPRDRVMRLRLWAEHVEVELQGDLLGDARSPARCSHLTMRITGVAVDPHQFEIRLSDMSYRSTTDVGWRPLTSKTLIAEMTRRGLGDPAGMTSSHADELVGYCIAARDGTLPLPTFRGGYTLAPEEAGGDFTTSFLQGTMLFRSTPRYFGLAMITWLLCLFVAWGYSVIQLSRWSRSEHNRRDKRPTHYVTAE